MFIYSFIFLFCLGFDVMNDVVIIIVILTLSLLFCTTERPRPCTTGDGHGLYDPQTDSSSQEPAKTHCQDELEHY